MIYQQPNVEELKARASNIVEGTPGAYTIAMFYADFPQFKKSGTETGFIPDAVINTFIAMANNTIAIMAILIYSAYSEILSLSCSSGTMLCRYHPNAARMPCQTPAPIVV